MQKEYFGAGRVGAIKEILEESMPQRIFLVTGHDSYLRSGASSFVTPLLENFMVGHFSGLSANPTLEDIEKGIRKFRKTSPDLVIAIGGGSVIDIAKSVAILAAQEGNSKDYVEGKKPIEKKGVPLVAIPTTAGSGSEATHFSVIYFRGKKYSLAHEYILPNWAIVDPVLTYSSSPKQTAYSGADALCQAIESCWSLQATDISRAYAHEALLLILNNIRLAVHQPNPDNRASMAYAAHLAGKAINISKTTASHAMSYPLTFRFGIPHGQAVSLTLPQLIIYNDHAGVAGLLGASTANEAATKVEMLFKDIGLATRLRDLGIGEKDIPTLVEEMSLERALNNPRNFTKTEAANILRIIW